MAISKTLIAMFAVFQLGTASFASSCTANHARSTTSDSYIITLRNDIPDNDIQTHLEWVRDVHTESSGCQSLGLPGIEKVYKMGNFHCYVGSFDGAIVSKILASPEVSGESLCPLNLYLLTRCRLRVLAVEPDVQLVSLALTAQDNPPWSLSAISSRTSGIKPYRYHESAGTGTFAYVLDTGINADHVEFGGRATLGFSADSKGYPAVLQSRHGALVSGVIGSKTYGVAKNTTIIAVQCNMLSNLLDAFGWIVDDIQQKGRAGRSVINLSLGFPNVPSQDVVPPRFALALAIDAIFQFYNVLTIVAAGNDGMPVNESSSHTDQGLSTKALVVGSVNEQWSMSSFSNYGPRIDIFAPGENIRSTDVGSTNKTRVRSGTSLAAPHVAGVALSLVAAENITSASVLRDRILDLATKDVITGLQGDTVNRLLYNAADE